MADEEQSNVSQPQSNVPSSSGGRGSGNVYKHSRITSTVAQTFAADLDSMFGLGMGGSTIRTGSGNNSGSNGALETLAETVEQKKEKVTSGQSELEQLEARLRETEQRLARVSRQNSPSRAANLGAVDENAGPSTSTAKQQAHPFSQRPTYPDDRPPTGQDRPQPERGETQQMMQGMPGAMPETPAEPAGRGDDYVMVEGGRQG